MNSLRKASSKGGKKSSADVSLASSTKTNTLIIEKDAKILQMQNEILALTNALSESQKSSSSTTKRRHHPLTAFSTTMQQEEGGGVSQVRSRMGRHASISTANVLNNLPNENEDALALRIVEMFKAPSEHLAYLKSEQFARDILVLAGKVKPVFEDEPRCIFLQSPCYVFGDIHGNLEDLHFFSDNIWRLGMSLTAGNFLFLGDYVDRGLSCLEVVAYLMAMKLLLPHKVFLLRGNHETRDVNGWEEHYGERSYIYQCRERFGENMGYRVWEETNQVFDRMPLAGVIDQDIFCVHGGIPRGVSEDSQIQDILSVPKVAGINPPYEHENEEYQQVASDCIWSDPASDEQEACGVDPQSGFGESLRGGGAICFGHRAVTNFLQQHGYSYIMRAHEAHAEGVAVSKGARVFTVFSTSKDHNQGSQAMAGCILVDFEKMHVINRSPAYKNKFVHRRDSISLAGMNEAEIAERMKLGLVTAADDLDDDEEEVSHQNHYGSSEDDDDSYLDFADDDFDAMGNGNDDNGYEHQHQRSSSSSSTGDRKRASVDVMETLSSPTASSRGSSGANENSLSVFDEAEIEKARALAARKEKDRRRLSGVMEDDEDEDEDEEEGEGEHPNWETNEWRGQQPTPTPPVPAPEKAAPAPVKVAKKRSFFGGKK